MNWAKVFITGIVGGVVVWLYNFLMHGLIMAKTYEKYEVFRQDASPVFFALATIFIAIFGALLFAKTRNSWSEGLKGGITFGFFCGPDYLFLPVHKCSHHQRIPLSLKLVLGWDRTHRLAYFWCRCRFADKKNNRIISHFNCGV